MKSIKEYPSIIKNILTNYIKISFTHNNINSKTIISSDRNTYLLTIFNDSQIHKCIIHLEIVDDKINIIRDAIKDGIVQELIDAGIPEHKITYILKPQPLHNINFINIKRIYEQNKAVFTPESNLKQPTIKPNATAAELINLSEIKYKYILKQIANHPNTPPNLLIELFYYFPSEVFSNPILDLLLFENPKFFEELYDKYSSNIFEQKNFNLPDFFIEWAINHERENIRANLAISSIIPIHWLEKLVNDSSCRVIQKLYLNNNLSSEKKEQVNQKRLELEKTCPYKKENPNCEHFLLDAIPF